MDPLVLLLVETVRFGVGVDGAVDGRSEQFWPAEVEHTQPDTDKNALLHTLAAYSKFSAHTAACPLTNWCHQHSSGVVPNNTGVLPCLSTGETAFVDAKVHS